MGSYHHSFNRGNEFNKKLKKHKKNKNHHEFYNIIYVCTKRLAKNIDAAG